MPVKLQQDMDSVEDNTRGQRNCSLWRELHKGSITSSKFGEVVHASNKPTTLAKERVLNSKQQKLFNVVRVFVKNS